MSDEVRVKSTNKWDPERVSYFATTEARGRRIPFGIKAKDRLRHMYVIGKTGMGKSTLLENLAIQDIQNGEGLCFVDPHGETAEKLLEYVPKERIDDVIYFAPYDMDFPIGFNIMEDVGYDKRHLVVAGLMSAFKRIWVDAWSSRMEYILQNTLLALLEYPDSTLIDVNRMFVDKEFRKKVIENTTDPIVKAYWTEEFTKYTDRYTQEATPAIQNKIGQFTSNPLIRNIIGQAKSTFDIKDIMDSRKILIVNLSKGRIGEQNADLLGSIITTKIYLEAMKRSELNPNTKEIMPPFYLYVDEFQSVSNDSFANILSEARKYKLALILAHQYIEQLEENIRAAVFGNAGTIISFRVGPFDAEVLKTVFEPHFTAEDLVNLGFAQIYLTLMVDGVATHPFAARTLPPFDAPETSYRDEIIKLSREKYGRKREEIEKQIDDRVKKEPVVLKKNTRNTQQSEKQETTHKKPLLQQKPSANANLIQKTKTQSTNSSANKTKEQYLKKPSQPTQSSQSAIKTFDDEIKELIKSSLSVQKALARKLDSLENLISLALNPPVQNKKDNQEQIKQNEDKASNKKAVLESLKSVPSKKKLAVKPKQNKELSELLQKISVEKEEKISKPKQSEDKKELKSLLKNLVEKEQTKNPSQDPTNQNSTPVPKQASSKAPETMSPDKKEQEVSDTILRQILQDE